MTSASRPNRINIDLQHYKQPWIDYCAERGTTPSEAFRQVVAKLLANAGVQIIANAVPVESVDGKFRKEIRLTAEEIQHAEALALEEGFSLTRWIVALVRARLYSTAQLGQQELVLLTRSNMHMLALGRNLNQIAKAMQANRLGVDRYHFERIEALHSAVKEHAATVAGVLAMNVTRWSAK